MEGHSCPGFPFVKGLLLSRASFCQGPLLATVFFFAPNLNQKLQTHRTTCELLTLGPPQTLESRTPKSPKPTPFNSHVFGGLLIYILALKLQQESFLHTAGSDLQLFKNMCTKAGNLLPRFFLPLALPFAKAAGTFLSKVMPLFAKDHFRDPALE